MHTFFIIIITVINLPSIMKYTIQSKHVVMHEQRVWL